MDNFLRELRSLGPHDSGIRECAVKAAEEIERLRADNKGNCRNGNTPLDGWRFDIENMPKEGRFEVLSAQPEVFRHLPNEEWVIIPRTGRMFKPYAWRAAVTTSQRAEK